MTSPLLAGDFGLVASDSLEGKIIRWATDSPVNHAFVYIGGGEIVEADPDGAVITDLSDYDGTEIIWSSGLVLDDGDGLDWVDRQHIVAQACDLVGTPYGWLDIAAIGLAQSRLGAMVGPNTWWVRRVRSDKTLVCSQLVDLAYKRAGVPLFDDDPTLPGLVSPGDLLRRLRAPRVGV